MPRASIVLVDESSAILASVSRMLGKEKGFNVVASFRDGMAIVRKYSQLRPNVIILDISLGELSGIEVAQYLRDSGCGSKIIFLTVHEDSDFLNAAMGAGAAAYVVKSRLSADLIPAIYAVLSDKVFVSPTLLYKPS